MIDPTLQQLQHLVSQGQLRLALEDLNRLAKCRFTAFFRFGERGLTNLILVDRNDATAAPMDTVPVDQSYCMFVQQSQDAFIVNDSLVDDRLGNHSKRPVVRSYVGYPIKIDGQSTFGTICHFDFEVVNISAEVLMLTQDFAEGFDSDLAMRSLHAGLDQRLDSLRRMIDTINLSSETPEQAMEAFEMYSGPLLREAERVLDSHSLANFQHEVRTMRTKFGDTFLKSHERDAETALSLTTPARD